jgi:hypothetical protein
MTSGALSIGPSGSPSGDVSVEFILAETRVALELALAAEGRCAEAKGAVARAMQADR